MSKWSTESRENSADWDFYNLCLNGKPVCWGWWEDIYPLYLALTEAKNIKPLSAAV